MYDVKMNQKEYATLGLMLITLLISRLKFAGSPAHLLPDATLAIFFLGGLYLRNYLITPIFLLTAGASDYFSIQNGVSSWCITPAYLLLIPTYLIMWAGGRRFSNLKNESLRTTLPTLIICSTLAFFVSSGGYYIFSGRYQGEQIFIKFSYALANYYPAYVGSALLYFVAAYFSFTYKINGPGVGKRLPSYNRISRNP
jgi:hypothetical protein